MKTKKAAELVKGDTVLVPYAGREEPLCCRVRTVRPMDNGCVTVFTDRQSIPNVWRADREIQLG